MALQVILTLQAEWHRPTNTQRGNISLCGWKEAVQVVIVIIDITIATKIL